MTITVAAPLNPNLYVEFTARCTYDNPPGPTNYDEHRIRYRLVQDGITIKEFHAYGQYVFNATQTTTFTYPLTAAAGTVIKIQWTAESVSTPAVTFYNHPSTQAYTFRSLIVTDKP
jgi:hypothetical protein